MNNKPSFSKTVNILVQAYLNDTLQNLNCHSCAVGNLVAAANGITYKKNIEGYLYWGNGRNPRWFDAMGCGFTQPDYISYDRAKKEAETTGYSYEELALIEMVFENPSHYNYKSEDDILDGLMAVVDVLAEIHNVDLSVKESAKLLLAKP